MNMDYESILVERGFVEDGMCFVATFDEDNGSYLCDNLGITEAFDVMTVSADVEGDSVMILLDGEQYNEISVDELIEALD